MKHKQNPLHVLIFLTSAVCSAEDNAAIAFKITLHFELSVSRALSQININHRAHTL